MANGPKDKIPGLRSALLAWYERNHRDLPWRGTRNPYAIWVSEIMLQQTRVAVVVDRYRAFMERFPTVFALAVAPEQDVLALWSGLGYYRRARMLHKAAKVVASTAHGLMPNTAVQLRALPGIGAYTAAAIASIAYDEPVAVVDGNVERVLCRLSGWNANNGHARKVEALAARLVHQTRPGDFNQAMMELGALVCLPRNPQCLVCPLADQCKTRGVHQTAPRPRAVIREVGHALCVKPPGNGSHREGPRVLLEQRPSSVTVMPGLWELPALRETPVKQVRLTVRHSIMNVNYVVRICDVREDELSQTIAAGERRWVPLADAETMALTGLARKVLKRLTSSHAE
jgi:A/G-specific adenine glycosylase